MNITQINNFNKNISFKKSSDKDSTYWLIKNPDSGEDLMEKHFALDFINKFPNWEQDKNLVHRLKQDTIKARIQGKIHSKWHEFDTFPGLSVLLYGIITALSVAMLIKHKDLSKGEKILFKAAAILSPLFAADNLKYIFTGNHFFNKKK